MNMSNKISRRMRMLKDCIDTSIQYDILEGIELLKKTTRVKFIESVDVAINLNIDTRQSDQNIRSYVVMPHSIGRDIRVAVFTQGDNIEIAKNSGADLVGLDDLFDVIKNKNFNLDVIIASSDVMHIVGKLGSILGPRGLMPNPKMGTVSDNIAESVKNVKLGQVRYRSDKGGIVHTVIGKLSLDSMKLKENLEALIMSLKQVKPLQCKGVYIEKIVVSTTMGSSIIINKNSLCIMCD